MTDGPPPESEPTQQVPAQAGGERGAPRGRGRVPPSPRRLVSSYPPADLTQRVRKIPDPSGRAAAPDGTLIDRHAQPLEIEHLAGPIRQSVEDAVRARSRALDHLSVRQGLAASTLVLVLGGFGTLAAAWVCIHAVTTQLGRQVTGQILLLQALSALAAVVTALLAYAVVRLIHHRAVRAGRGLVGLGLGGTVLVLLWLATLIVYQPWAFPGPRHTSVVPLSSIESALGGGHYRVVTYGQLSTGTLSAGPAVFLQTAQGRWEAAPLPEPLPLLIGLSLVRARAAPISAVSDSLGADQLRELRQRDELVGVLVGSEAVLAVALYLLQRARWRTTPQVPVSERELRRLVDHIQEHGTAPVEWSLGEDRLV